MLLLLCQSALWRLLSRDIWPEIIAVTCCVAPGATILLLAWSKAG
jgi:hypothetical protein